MKQRMAILAVWALLAALVVPQAWSQATTTVKGVCKDQQGNPIAGATVEYQNLDTGQKYSLKTNKKGEYFSLGVSPGKYKVTLLKNGQTLFFLNGVQVTLAQPETAVDFDLQKEQSRGQPQMSAEEKARREKIEKENTTIKALNEKLAAAKQAQDAGNFDQAIATMKDATNTDPNRDILWARLGDVDTAAAQAKAKSGDQAGAKQLYSDAATSYQKAIAIKPDGAYYNNLGQALTKSGQTDEAIKAYNQAAQIDPTHASMYYFNLGAVLTNAGKVDDAIAAFDKCIAADPNRADAYYWKGVDLIGKATTDKSGKMTAPPGTAEAFNKYLELQPQGQFAEPAKQMLASIGAPVETSFGKAKKSKK
jgi:tetratricopeptide (TPR) repeat protein